MNTSMHDTTHAPMHDTDEADQWAHRDQGVAAYLIAGGVQLLLLADVQTRHPLFVFAEPACSRVMEQSVTYFKLHTLDSFKHRRPQRVHAWAMACADRQLDALLARARDAGMDEIEVPPGTLWIWAPDAEEKASLSSPSCGAR